jgi:rhamnose utilization protein RhaD (predicted bifunctional aldolase and dehydrogenase)
MDKLESLVQISRYYGKNPAYVIAGGGNTSYKNSEELFIKASGISLATIDTDGFVVMSRALLGEMEDKEYAAETIQREEEVKQDLKKAIIYPEHLRPSVETSLHNLIRYSYVIHTHPTSINAMMCAKDAEKEVEERFGSEALYVEYTDPGYILFKKIRDQIRAYKEQYHTAPKIIFLQNHGIFVGANSAHQVKSIYDSIESRIRARRDLSIPEGKIEEFVSEASKYVSGKYKQRGLITKAFRNPLIQHFSASKKQYQLISRPFTPDIIVYCKSNYLFIEKGMGGETIGDALDRFDAEFGYYPKVIVEEQGGLILVEESEKSVQTVLEVYFDMLKISYLSNQYGGPHFMSDEQISFIDNWEVENYRRSVAKTK